MKSVTMMAQMWGFAHWKLKLSSARPRAPKQSTGLFLSFGLPCSNPALYSKNKKPQKRLFIFGADVGIRTPEASLKTYTISNRAPSASSDISPHSVCLTNVKRLRSIAQLRCGLKRFFRVEAFAATVRRILRGMIQDAPHRRGWLTVKPSDSPVSLHCPFISRRNCVQ